MVPFDDFIISQTINVIDAETRANSHLDIHRVFTNQIMFHSRRKYFHTMGVDTNPNGICYITPRFGK